MKVEKKPDKEKEELEDGKVSLRGKKRKSKKEIEMEGE